MRFATGLQICLSSALCEKTAKGGGSATELKTNDVLAEGVGFEPTVRLPVQRFSSLKILVTGRVVL